MKKTYVVTYRYNHGDAKVAKVRAETAYDAAKAVEYRRFGNFILDVQLA